MKWVIATAVVVLVSQSAAYLKSPIGRDGDVAGIEQAVKICPQQQAISYLMWPVLSIRPNMRRLEGRKRMLFRDGTPTTICIEHRDSERSLSEPRQHGTGVTIAGTALDRNQELRFGDGGRR